MISEEPRVPAEVTLLTPCVRTYRYEFNKCNQLVFGSRRDDAGQLEPYAMCVGNPSEECGGGSIDWPPDPITQQDAFAVVIDGICTARHRYIREKNGKTTPVEA